MDFTKIDALHDKLKTLRPLNNAELKRLRGDFMVENTYDSNAIEGNTLTLRETGLVLEGLTIAEKPLKMHLEVIGHRDAFEYMLKLADANEPLTERRIKEIHSLVMIHEAEIRGVYRNLPVIIRGAIHVPPQPYLVAPQMEALLADWETLKSSKHIIEAVAEFHLRFEGIHPFLDGNGRTGRLILNLELIKAGLLPVNIKFTDRRKYYDCFDFYFGDGGKVEPLTQLIAGYEVSELERRIEILEAIE
ncbi:MAG: Fic family protein [Firmicutes bacterium]|nr:Fic family protein [Bacillota bacterium]